MPTPFSSVVAEIQEGHTQHYTLFQDQVQLSYRQVVVAWQQNSGFRDFFLQQLQDSPFNAFFWETPPISKASFDQPFEFVLVHSRGLAHVRPEEHAFQNRFHKSREGIAVFSNLGGDATLVVPSNESEKTHYPHLAAFVRNGPDFQIHNLWKRVGEAIEVKLSDRPLWVSTAGMGVFWLHVRLDSRPKYYRFRPYKNPPIS